MIDPDTLKQKYGKFSIHPLKPFLPAHAKILFLGSFPPPEARWSMNFYYPNFQNDMWRIMGLIFYKDKNYFVKVGEKAFDYNKVVAFCHSIGLALYDAAYVIKREKGNASDKFLNILVPTDLKAVLMKIPQCDTVVATGGKSAETAATTLGCTVPETGSHVMIYLDCIVNSNEIKLDDKDKIRARRHIKFYRMPSSSRAYPMSIEKKAEIYRKLFPDLAVLKG